ncbi:MAG: hypothetical protein ACOVNR_05955 [Chitinophagaceae bacterium]
MQARKILIISPHYPPSNLAAVHRSRLFAQHLPAFGWQPIILTVHENYYEESLDWHLHQLLPTEQRIEKVKAFPVTKPRMIGDIGLRAFFQLYARAKQLIKKEAIDFLYIPIPSFYVALLGRWLHASTGIAYGIDYIDPWVHHFPGSEKKFSRHWWSTQIAKWLEPIAVKKAVLITGVAEGYYRGVLERNPHLKKQAITGAMPYGGEEMDHLAVKKLGLSPYLFQKRKDKLQLVYAGAMLPKAYQPLEAIFKVLANSAWKDTLEIHFIGTGSRPNDANSYTIKPLAENYGLWQTTVFEYAARIPYLQVLTHLNAADGVFILGSTEPHYTPSKTYQAVLSGKPILAVLHQASSAVKVLREANAGVVLVFDGEGDMESIVKNGESLVAQFVNNWLPNFQASMVNKKVFDEYSAYNVTKNLNNLIRTWFQK